ncbi:MAG: hypothetical protein A2231_03005 [Candidatus Firestonebacteria bacterium RIFOXYA2_FULL_40_8]|nr:MAG: hypothetical protein A2231_03005 [Candidatus Firestonebacteria bacterium RIFOXYA2_FULL_40_8]
MNTCEEIKNRIPEYYYDELQPEEKAGIDAHLKNCSQCAEELKAITAVLTRVSKAERPVLSASLYPLVKEKLEKRRAASGKFWNLPFAATVGLLILLAVFSNTQNIASMRKAEVEEKSIVANVIDLNNSENIDLDSLSSLDVEILADELFMEDNLMTFGS